MKRPLGEHSSWEESCRTFTLAAGSVFSVEVWLSCDIDSSLATFPSALVDTAVAFVISAGMLLVQTYILTSIALSLA